MSKKSFGLFDNSIFETISFDNAKQRSTFTQARNKLIETAKKHVKKNGLTNNILGVLSQSNYMQSNYMQSNYMQSNYMQSNYMQSNYMQSNYMQSNYMQSMNRYNKKYIKDPGLVDVYNTLNNDSIKKLNFDKRSNARISQITITSRQKNENKKKNEKAQTLHSPQEKKHTVLANALPATYLNPNEIIVICNNHSGGSIKFITDIKNYYKVSIKFIKSKNELLSYKLTNSSIIIIQSFLFTDFNVDIIVDTYNKYNCKIIIPIHDWYWFIYPYLNNYSTSIHNQYLSNLIVPEKTKNLFSICDKILCPSKFVYDNIYNKLPKNTNIYLQEWIDYNYTSYINNIPNVLPIYNDVINIGILHAVDEYKGIELIKYLHHTCNSYKKYKINYLVPGVNIAKYAEAELFTHIEKYHIHGLLHLNKWGETYCYTLTKTLMCGLPILYNDVGSFKSRIPHWGKYTRNCSKESDYYNKELLHKNLKTYLDYIIRNERTYKKTNFDLNFHSSLLFDVIFSDSNKMCKPSITLGNDYIENLVIITSKIHCSTNKFTYSNTRSIYSSEQRFNDTLKTIESIRKYMPNSKILLLDNSAFTTIEFDTLNKVLDFFLNRTNISDIDFYTNICTYKAFGEIAQIVQINKYLLSNNVKFKNMFKISGRYFMNEQFNIDNYKINKNVMKKAIEVKADNYYYTSFYKIYYEYFNNFVRCINLLLKNESILKHKDSLGLEQHLYSLIKNDTILIETLGITQNIAVWDQKNKV